MIEKIKELRTYEIFLNLSVNFAFDNRLFNKYNLVYKFVKVLGFSLNKKQINIEF